jgi:hypothetical protein
MITIIPTAMKPFRMRFSLLFSDDVSAVLTLKKSNPWQDESADGVKKVNRRGIVKIMELPVRRCPRGRE